MILTYNLSALVKKNLADFEQVRTDIALIPLPPIVEARLRFATTIDRIYYWLTLATIPITRADIIRALSTTQKPKKTISLKQIVNYRSALSYLYLNVLGSPDPVTIKSIQNISDHINYPVAQHADVSHTLTYLQANTSIHPLVEAAIIHLQFAASPIAHLAPLIILYKYGYDLRGMVCPESLFFDEKEHYFAALQQISTSSTLTIWLEFYTGIMVRNAHHIKRLVHEVNKNTGSAKGYQNFNLTSRQKNILTCFDEPGITLTNRDIQRLFKVSQITASRDLSKLATRGLVFIRGKGRSICYTRT